MVIQCHSSYCCAVSSCSHYRDGEAQADKEVFCNGFRVHINDKLASLGSKHLATCKRYRHGNRNTNAPCMNLPIPSCGVEAVPVQ